MTNKLEKLLKKQEELQAHILKEKNQLSQVERKLDIRRKIILGSLMLDMMKKGKLDENNIMKELDDFLSRDTERKLFNFPPHPKDKSDPTTVTKSSTVEIIIEDYDFQQKIALIKALRALNFGLKEVKNLLSTLPTSVIKVDSTKAQQIKHNLVQAGAKVILKQ